ncbi:aspartate--tRNA ligase [Candidatus Peregrinibacteria bacterium CG_4_9_14_0_2_um_filter_53_11]|nr:MAG: aspartate--tRNA ligase [Candidatus Peregrinibacteria bacterium CG_4_9_14_0_2_um_filter_53_11]
MYRTHTCNDLTASDIGTKVTLSGWVRSRRDHGGLIFIDLRDRYGLTQVVSDPTNSTEVHPTFEQLRSEYVVKVTGVVRARPQGMANPRMHTGEIEVLIDEVEILNESKTPPFAIDSDEPVNEELRLKYRYLDLRRDRLKRNVEVRHKTIKFIRDFLSAENFLEIETPILIKGTPEGSREYMVPSRLHPGTFYVLPQSPQQLKQLSMVAGLDRYFQIARCFRDEDQRGDRQPEFTQLDLEMSFVDEEDVMEVNERLMIALCQALVPEKKLLQAPFPRMSWHEAMSRYGSDKPDIRFGMEMMDGSELFAKSEFKVFSQTVASGGVVKMLKVEGGGARFSRNTIDGFEQIAKTYGAKGLAYVIVEAEGLKSPILKFLGEAEVEALKKELNLKVGDIVFFAADSFEVACTSLGQVRLACADIFELRDPNVFAFLWVVDFPMFEWSKEDQTISAAHHPFCSIKVEDLHLLESEPLKARAKAYDFVLNGVEVGGGSIRIHKPEIQAKIFETLGISAENAQKRFGHMLEAFTYGAPPHGGIAWGLDRLVMIFCNEPNIREVIVFPKDQKARDLMLDAPSELPVEQIREMHIQVIEKDLPSRNA